MLSLARPAGQTQSQKGPGVTGRAGTLKPSWTIRPRTAALHTSARASHTGARRTPLLVCKEAEDHWTWGKGGRSNLSGQSKFASS